MEEVESKTKLKNPFYDKDTPDTPETTEDTPEDTQKPQINVDTELEKLYSTNVKINVKVMGNLYKK